VKVSLAQPRGADARGGAASGAGGGSGAASGAGGGAEGGAGAAASRPGAVSFLAPGGPLRILGGAAAAAAGAGVEPLQVRADTLFGPRGVALGPAAAGGPLAVCDTGHHRLLLWRSVPERDHAPADLILGQPDFTSEGRNGGRTPGAATLHVPTGVAIERDLLAVADAWNHRVLLWHGLPTRSNAPADVVLGQADFTAAAANRGRASAAADTLHWCYGVALLGGRLVVADTGNRRVLIWNRVPTANGQPADLVLGQRDFLCRDENAGGAPGPLGMRWPHAAAAAAGGLQIADAGNHRILGWRTWPAASAAPADLVLGQSDFATLDPNGGAYWPDAATLNMPYGLAAAGEWLVAADTSNSRLLAWRAAHLDTAAAAAGLAAQDDFAAKGDNRWQPATRDSLCWPYALAARDGLLAVADSGNNRVSLWRLVP
jgi:hypothetical protein